MSGTGAGAGGLREVHEALCESRRLFASIGLFSVFVNLLMLTGPLFMLQVYDRVLTSRSEPTLVALIVIVAFLFLMMGLLDHFRARVLARAGARFQARLDPRVLGAILARAGRSFRASPRVRDRSRSSTRHGRRCSCSCCSPSTGCWGCWRCSPVSC